MNAGLYKRVISDGAPLFLLISLAGLLEASVCPSKEDMAPCKCFSSFSHIYVDCYHILSQEELIPPMWAIKRNNTKVSTLTIKHSSLSYLPDNLFQNAHISQINFDNTEIMSLSESGTAFKGLEKDLMVIGAYDVKYVSEWNFEQLRNLKNLRRLSFHLMPLDAIDHPLPNLPELTILDITSAEISYIADEAFSNLPKLTYFLMNGNRLKEIKRNMFSNPAKYLKSIDLSQNILSHLPNDFFENMPSLSDVSLDMNKFVTLSEKPFSVALRNLQTLSMSIEQRVDLTVELFSGTFKYRLVDQLRQQPVAISLRETPFKVQNNPFRCDCRMQWLVNSRFPPSFNGECSKPDSLHGKSISTVDFKSLTC